MNTELVVVVAATFITARPVLAQARALTGELPWPVDLSLAVLAGGGFVWVVKRLFALLETYFKRQNEAQEKQVIAVEVGFKDLASAHREQTQVMLAELRLVRVDVIAEMHRVKGELHEAIGVEDRLENIQRAATGNTGPHQALSAEAAVLVVRHAQDDQQPPTQAQGRRRLPSRSG